MAGEVIVGTVKGYLELEDKWTPVLKNAATGLDKIGPALENAGKKMTVGITMPMVAAGGASLAFASKFESTMTKVETLADVSRQQVDAWKKDIMSMSDAVGRGPGELARGLLVVTSAGERGTAALSVLNEAAKASSIGLGSTDVVARAVTGAMQAYSASGLDAATATRTMIATVVEGNVEADELAGTLGRVVGISAQAGVSFQEVGAFLATFTRVGVDAAEAVTALRGILSATLNPTKEAREALAGLKDPVTGATYSIDALRDAIKTKGLTQALLDLYGMVGDNVDALGAIVPNIRALSGFLGTAGSQGAQFAGIIERINEAAGNANYTNDKFARTTEDLDHKWGALKAKLETAAITLGNDLLPAAVRVVQDGLTPVAEKAAWVVREFDKLPESAKGVTTGIIGIGVVAGPAMWALGGLATAIKGVASALVWLGSTSLMTSSVQIVKLLSAGGVAGAPLVWLNIKAGIVEATTALGSFIAKLTPWTGWLLGIGALSAGMKGTLGEGGLGGLKMDISSVLWNSKGSRFGTSLPTPVVTTSEQFALAPGAGKGKGGGAAAPALSEEMQKLLAQFNGAGALKDARNYEIILRSIGGASRLAAKDQQEFRDVFQTVADQYRLMGPAGEKVVAHYEKLAKTIPLASQSWGGMLLEAPKVTEATQYQADVMNGAFLPSYDKAGQAIDAMVERTKENEQALKDLHIISPVITNDTREMTKALDQQYPKFEETTKALDDLARSFTDLAQISGGSMSTFMRAAGSVVSTLGLMTKSVDSFAKAKEAWKNATDQVGKTAAALQMAGSAMSAAAAGFGFVLTIIDMFESKAKAERAAIEASNKMVESLIKEQGGLTGLNAKLALTGASWGNFTSILQRVQGDAKQTQHVLDNITAALDNLKKRQDAANTALATMETAVTSWLDPIAKAKEELDEAQKAYDELIADPPDKKATKSQIERYNEELAKAKANLDKAKKATADMTGDAQTRFNSLGVYVTATFAGLLHTTGDFYGSLDRMRPLLEELAQGQKVLGLTAKGGIADLLKITEVKEKYKSLLDPLYAGTVAVKSLSDAGIESQDAYKTLADDAERTFNAMIKGGVNSEQAMALMQPTLQILWQKWKDGKIAVDDETKAILEQAEKHGIVGENQKTINERMLDAFGELKKAIDAMTLAITDWGKAAEEGFRKATEGAITYGKAVPRGTPAVPGVPAVPTVPVDGGSGGTRTPDTMHVGGLVRASHAGASYWHGGAAMAARYAHRGRYLKPGEVPIIGRVGEGVLSDDVGMPALGAAMGMAPEAALGVLNAGGVGGGGDVNQTINVYVTDELVETRTARGLQKHLDIMVR